METVSNGATHTIGAYPCDKPAAADGESYSENFDCFELGSEEAAATDVVVVESFEQLHQSIPWLQKAQVSSDSCKGQLKILQAAIDYIIDLEEQLTEHLSEDLYRVAIRESKAALERSLTSGRRPFADVNAEEAGDADEDGEELPLASPSQQPSAMQMMMRMSSSFLSSANLHGEAEELHRSS